MWPFNKINNNFKINNASTKNCFITANGWDDEEKEGDEPDYNFQDIL